jgi:hypothetical protein
VATTPKGVPYPLGSDSPPDVPVWMQALATKLDSDFLTRTDADAAYVNVTGGDTITASAATVIPLVVRGAASQSANLLEARDGAGTVLARITPGGNVRLAENGAQRIIVGAADPGGAIAVTNHTAAAPGLVVRGAASQTANLAEFQNSAGTVLARIEATGRLFIDASATAPIALAGGFFSSTASTTVIGKIPIDIGGTVRFINIHS